MMKKWVDYVKDFKSIRFVQKIDELIAQNKIQKSQIALVVLSLGAIVFLSIPGSKSSMRSHRNSMDSKVGTLNSKAAGAASDSETILQSDITQMESELEQMLSKVKGVGRVKVMITLKDAGQQVINKDVNETTELERTERQEQTVIVQDAEGNQTALVTRQLQPEIMGVVVICEGGEDPQVISDVSYAVQVLFSLSAHKVKVMKMNS